MKCIRRAVPVLVVLSAVFCLINPGYLLSQQSTEQQVEKDYKEQKKENDDEQFDVEVITVRNLTKIALPDIEIKAGTTVVWINMSGSIIEILFPVKKVMLACDKPVNFIQDSDGTFVSNKIPVGATASLCFIEKEKFEYLVTNITRSLPAGTERRMYKGKIVVK